MATEDYCFPFDFNNFLSDPEVAMMNAEEVGAYLMLMLYCWKSGTITSDDVELAALSKTGDGWEKVKQRVLKRFQKTESGYEHKHMNTLRTEADKKRQLKSKAGKASGKARRDRAL